MVRGMAKPTYRQAQDVLLDHLEREGWRVSRHLKVPHATSRGRGHRAVRIWFKPQALWYSCGPDSVGVHSLANARSLWVDVREASPAEVVAAAERACNPDPVGASRDPAPKLTAAQWRVLRQVAANEGMHLFKLSPEPRRRTTLSGLLAEGYLAIDESRHLRTTEAGRAALSGSSRASTTRRDPSIPGREASPGHYYCSRTRASRGPHDPGGKKLCWPVRVLRQGDGVTYVRGLAGRFAGREFGATSSEVTRYVPSGYVMAPGTKEFAPPAARRDPASRGTSPAKTTWVLQTNYGYGQGWKDGEEFTSAEKAEKALQRANRSKYSSFPHRLVVKGSERHRNRGARDPAPTPSGSTGSTRSFQPGERVHVISRWMGERHHGIVAKGKPRMMLDAGVGRWSSTDLEPHYLVLFEEGGRSWENARDLHRSEPRDRGRRTNRRTPTPTSRGRSGRDQDPPSTRRGLLGRRPPASQRGSTPASEAQLVDMTYMLHQAGYTRAPRQIAVTLREQYGVSPAELEWRLKVGELAPVAGRPDSVRVARDPASRMLRDKPRGTSQPRRHGSWCSTKCSCRCAHRGGRRRKSPGLVPRNAG